MSAQDQLKDMHETPPPVALYLMATGYYVSQAIYVAAKLGIADALKNGPKTCDELAQISGTHAPSLYRLLRVLASVGVFAELEHDRFGLTPIGACLRSGEPDSLRAMVLMFAGERLQRAWGGLLHSVRTGETAFDHVFGAGLFPYLAQNPEAAVVFDEAMASLTMQLSAAVAAAYDFSQFGTLVDVGGGHGALITAILRASPTLRGMLFDLPHVAEDAKKRLEAAGLTGRCTVVEGDFFASVPSGGDAYTLSRVIHDWDDARSVAILKNCHRAMGEQGKLLLVELVLPARVDQSAASQIVVEFDLTMLVDTGGRERTEAEFRALFEATGFRLTRIVLTQSPFGYSVIEGVRV